jgi:SAM-dependent methyltransferase
VIAEGTLACGTCDRRSPIIKGVPRFVPRENYASGFGLEWTLHARTQYDSYSGSDTSRRRFFEETRWPQDLRGEVILEVGSGSGRFTEQAASTGATVISLDYSYAVDANMASNGHRPNVLIVQADLYQPPFRRASFDRLFCFGMLQHTPDVRRAFMALPPMLVPGGSLVADVYRKSLMSTVFATKYYARVLTRRMDPDKLYRWCRRWVDLMWPVTTQVRRVPVVGPSINWRLLVPDYSALALSDRMLKEWAYLDAFDMLAPRYDTPQTAATMRRWCEEARLTAIDVCDGYNGIEVRARVPA